MHILCGRLDQNDIPRLLADFAWADELFNRSHAEGSYNVAPGSYRPVMHVDEDALFVDDMFWGYRASWAEASGKIPVAINTRLEKISNRYWSGLLKRGRAIVPANGWYEWTGEKGAKQPWHIHRADGAPIYMAALARVPATDAPKGEPKGESKGESKDQARSANGFTIVTADAGGGLVDVHDRRPVVLSAADAALWLDPALPAGQAEQLLRSMALGADSFAWHAVDRSMGNVRRQGAEVALPVAG
jgi:putative SOS response-associated peptidase YedK